MLDRATFLRPYAHRGLHDKAAGIIENTGPAFEAAIGGGYAIECDLRAGAGGLPLVFHDETLDRLIGVPGHIGTVSARDAARLAHTIGGAPILTYTELLALVAGRVPLLVEIKSEWDPPNLAFLRHIAAATTHAGAPIALMSFDPAVMSVVRELNPRLPCGIVSGSYRGGDWWREKLSAERQAALRDLKDPPGLMPDFYAYEVDALPTPATTRARAAGTPVFTWTVRSEAQRAIADANADAMIFEGFKP